MAGVVGGSPEIGFRITHPPTALPAETLELAACQHSGRFAEDSKRPIAIKEDLLVQGFGVGRGYGLPVPRLERDGLIFASCDLVVLNKIDYLSLEPFDAEAFARRVKQLNPKAPLCRLSCRTQAGLSCWLEWLEARLRAALG